ATSAGAAPFIDGHTVLPGFTRAGPRRERKLGPRVEASICARRAIDLGSRLTIALRLLPDDRHWNAVIAVPTDPRHRPRRHLRRRLARRPSTASGPAGGPSRCAVDLRDRQERRRDA